MGDRLKPFDILVWFGIGFELPPINLVTKALQGFRISYKYTVPSSDPPAKYLKIDKIFKKATFPPH